MKKIFTLLFALTLLTSAAFSQVAINTNGSSADPSAMLDVKSTTKGLLPPCMSQAEIIMIANPANGLTVYNTDEERFYFYANGAGEWKEVAIGNGTITPWTCGDVLIDSRDGKSYPTVLIGSQCWMAANLDVGTRIDGLHNQTDNSIIEKYCYANNDANCTDYGGLYQWDEMMQFVTTEGVQGICPSGWHIPTDAEWCTLENEVDAGTISCSTTGLRGTDAGGNLKESGTNHWTSPNTGATNSSGFTALPGGYRLMGGSFHQMGNYGYWRSSSEFSEDDSWRRVLYYNYSNVGRGEYGKLYGRSVRCIKD